VTVDVGMIVAVGVIVAVHLKREPTVEVIDAVVGDSGGSRRRAND
jgi:hypothetical protein